MRTNADLVEMLREVSDAVLADEMDLSDWEDTFIADMTVKLRRQDFRISDKQEAVILKIWNRSKGRV